jgi:hypothetical protein
MDDVVVLSFTRDPIQSKAAMSGASEMCARMTQQGILLLGPEGIGGEVDGF